MKKLLFIATVLTALALATGCKDSQMSQYNALGKEHYIFQYGCNGNVINKWTSTGSVSNEEHSDGWYFEDSATHKLVEVTGTILILVK
jgi:hypothetical protein